MLFKDSVVFTGDAGVDNGPLVMFEVEPVGKVEFARADEVPVGRMVLMVELVAVGISGRELKGAVMLATTVMFATGGVELVPLPGAVGKAPGDEVPLPSKALDKPVLDSDVILAEVTLLGTGYTIVVEVNGTMMLVVEETVALAGREKVTVVEFSGTVTLKMEEMVSLVGRGKATVVESKGTTILMVEEEAVVLVGRGKASVVEFKGMTMLVEVIAETDALLGAGPEGGAAVAVSMGLVGVPVPDGGRADSEPLPVGKGGRTLSDSGSGSELTLPDGTGAKSVDEPVVMMRLVAAAVPLTIMVVRLPVMAPADSIVLPGMDSVEALEVGKGATSVVVLMGTMTLVAAAVPLMLTVDRVAVITPPESVAVPEAAVLLVNGAETDGGGVEVYTGLTVVTEGTNVLLT